MEWIKNLPLDEISNKLAQLLIWWANFVDGIPDNQLSLVVYVISSVVVLLLWFLLMRLLPRTIGIVSVAFVAAILFSPSNALGDSGDIAPAMIGVFYALLMKDFMGMLSASLPIFATFVVFLIIGAIWQMLRSVIESDIVKKEELRRIQKQKQQNLVE